MANNNSSSAPSKVPRYYVAYQERAADPKVKTDGDGYSMYRALARLTIGDPTKYTAIRDAVLLFAMRVRAQPSHILHSQYLAHEAAFRSDNKKKELFAYLDCPDLLSPDKEICWVIATALKVQINVYNSVSHDGQLGRLAASAGAFNMRPLALVAQNADSTMAVRYFALLPDESGKALVEYLQTAKKSMDSQARLPSSSQASRGLKLRQLSWAWKKEESNNTFTSFNEFRTNSKLKDLDPGTDLDRMDTFTVVVNDPRHIKPALGLFHNALARAPNQKRDVKASSSVKPGRMLPHCAADAEFVKLPKESVVGKNPWEKKDMITAGEVEELCSVFTLAVGIHFSLVVNVLHMLQHANKETVPALEQLFKETIFNTKIIKLWWNLQSDFFVLDNTIAHMFQGTARKPFLYHPYKKPPRLLIPTFRIVSSLLNGVRPAGMEFPKGGKNCELHLPGTNDLNMSCPCRLRNIDIAALLNHFGRLHGFPPGKMKWKDYRDGVNYGHLICYTLHYHRLFPLLHHLKDVAGSGESTRDNFYQSLGAPGMEKDDNAMGYVIMDVFSLNIIIERFLAQDDSHLIASSLYCYCYRGTCISLDRMHKPTKQHQSTLGPADDIPLFEDNPKRFKRDPFWKDYGSLPYNDEYRYIAMDPSVVATSALSQWQHDERVKVSRAIVRSETENPPNDDLVGWGRVSDEDPIERHRRLLMEQTKDPLAFWWPSGPCADLLQEEYPDPIVRAGTTHTEAVIELLKSPVCREIPPPPGFGADPGSKQGLPKNVGRVPGSGLEHAREIFEAYRKKTGSGTGLGKLRRVSHTMPVNNGVEANYDALVRKEIDNNPECWGSNKWESAAVVRSQLLRQIQKEEELNNKYGKPSYPDSTDVFDPEGREYRRRVEATAAWNRPVVTGIPRTNEDGTWRSTATEMLKALDKLVPPESPKRAAAWEEVSSKRRRR